MFVPINAASGSPPCNYEASATTGGLILVLTASYGQVGINGGCILRINAHTL